MTDYPRYWKKLARITPDDFAPPHPKLLQETAKFYDCSIDDARELIEREHYRTTFYVNDIYQVAVTPQDDTPNYNGVLQINIRRRDGGANLRDWRHFQQIKNEVAGEEREAIEVYPAESRKVDTSNKWHLWVLPADFKFPFGWQKRDVQYGGDGKDVPPGMRQRPL